MSWTEYMYIWNWTEIYIFVVRVVHNLRQRWPTWEDTHNIYTKEYLKQKVIVIKGWEQKVERPALVTRQALPTPVDHLTCYTGVSFHYTKCIYTKEYLKHEKIHIIYTKEYLKQKVIVIKEWGWEQKVERPALITCQALPTPVDHLPCYHTGVRFQVLNKHF